MRIIVWTKQLRDRWQIRRRLRAVKAMRPRFERDAARALVLRRLTTHC